MGKISDTLKGKKFTAGFAFLSFMVGLLFVEGSFSGNAVVSDDVFFNPISLIGSLLIICSVILIVYSLKKK